MKSILGICLVAILATGCAANTQCLKDNAALREQHAADQKEIRDTNAHLVTVTAERTGGDVVADGAELAKSVWAWAVSEAPIAKRQAEAEYGKASDWLSAAKKCYTDHGGSDAHTAEEYRAIANACIGK